MTEEIKEEIREIDIDTGVVIWFNSGRGYGFIKSNKFNDDVFVHFSKIDGPPGEFKVLDAGDEVEFERFTVERGDKNKIQAKNIKLIEKI